MPVCIAWVYVWVCVCEEKNWKRENNLWAAFGDVVYYMMKIT